MKTKFAFIGLLSSLLILVLFYSFLSKSFAQEASFVWRPLCNATVQGTTNPVQTPVSPWKESWDGSDYLTYCYVNESIIYLEKPILFNFLGEPFIPTYPDTYIEGVAYTQPVGPKKVGDIQVLFDVYFPYYNDDPAKCYAKLDSAWPGIKNARQFVLIGDENANFSDETGGFSDVIYELNSTEAVCGQWLTFSHLVSDFPDDYGTSFNRNSRTMNIFGVEMANVYIKNIRVVGEVGTKQIW